MDSKGNWHTDEEFKAAFGGEEKPVITLDVGAKVRISSEVAGLGQDGIFRGVAGYKDRVAVLMDGGCVNPYLDLASVVYMKELKEGKPVGAVVKARVMDNREGWLHLKTLGKA